MAEVDLELLTSLLPPPTCWEVHNTIPSISSRFVVVVTLVVVLLKYSPDQSSIYHAAQAGFEP